MKIPKNLVFMGLNLKKKVKMGGPLHQNYPFLITPINHMPRLPDQDATNIILNQLFTQDWLVQGQPQNRPKCAFVNFWMNIFSGNWTFWLIAEKRWGQRGLLNKIKMGLKLPFPLVFCKKKTDMQAGICLGVWG